MIDLTTTHLKHLLDQATHQPKTNASSAASSPNPR